MEVNPEDIHTGRTISISLDGKQINGYQEISPPLIANISSMFGTGQLPKFENDQFELKLDNKS